MAKLLTAPPAKIGRKAQDSTYLAEYAGKWVLVVHEQVVASGATPKEVLSKSPKDIPPGDTFFFKVPTPEETSLVVAEI